MNKTESNEAAKVRLAWVMAVTGYDPDAPGAWLPHLLHADGSLEDTDGSLWWQAGEECVELHGMYSTHELTDLFTHMVRVQNMLAIERALPSMKAGRPGPSLPPAVRSMIAPPAPITPRLRLAFRLLHLGLRVVPDGPSRDMLRHLLRHWWRRWYAMETA